MRRLLRGVCVAVFALFAAAPARAGDPTKFKRAGADQLSFSVSNMDRSADPRRDFYRYAAGAWLDRIERPSRLASLGVFDFMLEHLKAQLGEITEKAAAAAASAPKGSPTQQVGDLYRAFMDVDKLDAQGAGALQGEFARIDALKTTDDLADYLGHYAAVAGEAALVALGPSIDQADAKKMSIYLVGGGLVLLAQDIYDDPEGSPRVAAYLAYVRDILTLSGYETPRAEAIARQTLALERELHAAKLKPVERVDPRAGYNPQPLAAVQAAIPNLDLSRLARAYGLAPPDIVILTEPRYLPALSKMLSARPLSDFQTYLKVKLIARFSSSLGTRYDAPASALNQALLGVSELPPRNLRAQGVLQEFLGHPLAKLYVEAHFRPETREKMRDMVERIRAAFEARIRTRAWLTEPTRQAALDKLAKLKFRIGYPETWIDYSTVDVRPDDLLGDIMRLNAYSTQRDIEKLGRPVVRDEFSNWRFTLPVVINAGYDSLFNGFEVPAAFLQPAAYDPDMDVAVNFCRVGAVLGHEITHGFDSGGRRYDADGNLRDWWTETDSQKFEAEAAKLVAQADQFEVLPGLKANGALEVKENMADVGGLNLAYDALQAYLKQHPDENVAHDGLTPAQRCFLSWAQMWTQKITEQAVRSEVLTDAHPPGAYRAVAAPQHVDAFYEAFSIRPGDPMWLAPEQRARAW